MTVKKIELTKEHIAAINRRRRVIINYDAMDTVERMLRDAKREEIVKSLFYTIDAEGSPIDSVWWSWGGGHWFPAPSKVLPLINEQPFVDWAASGFNIVKVCLEEAKKRPGMESFYSYRINGADNYCSYPDDASIVSLGKWKSSPGGPLLPPIKQAHPDWVMDSRHVSPWRDECQCPLWNFAVQGVRDYKVSILRELAEDYDFDGIEIDFTRVCPVLLPGHQWENRDALTEFIRSVRTMLLEIEERRGRPFLLVTRVPENLQGCHFDGLDVETWAREQLVDIFTLGIRSFDVDISAFRRITEGTEIKLYPSIEDGQSSDGYHCPPIEVFRGVFANWRYLGGDGIQTMNFINHDPKTKGGVLTWASPRAVSLHRQVYSEEGNPEALKYKDKTFVVQRRGGGHDASVVPLTENWYTPRRMYCNTNFFGQLPASISNDSKVDTLLTMVVADDVNAADNKVKEITMRILVSDSSAKDLPKSNRLEQVVIETWLRKLMNIPSAKGIEKLVEVRINNLLLCPSRIEKGWLVYPVEPKQMAVGVNLVGIRVTERSSAVSDEVMVEKLELHVKYK